MDMLWWRAFFSAFRRLADPVRDILDQKKPSELILYNHRLQHIQSHGWWVISNQLSILLDSMGQSALSLGLISIPLWHKQSTMAHCKEANNQKLISDWSHGKGTTGTKVFRKNSLVSKKRPFWPQKMSISLLLAWKPITKSICWWPTFNIQPWLDDPKSIGTLYQSLALANIVNWHPLWKKSRSHLFAAAANKDQQ